MMGTQDNKGIIPRLCDSLFGLIAKQQSSELTYKVEVSYMEIYNEKVSLLECMKLGDVIRYWNINVKVLAFVIQEGTNPLD